MTINSEVRVAGPFLGNGITVDFPFNFKVFGADEVLVVQANAGVEVVLGLNTDYTVALNVDQEAAPGGVVTLLAGPLPSGESLTLTSALAPLQPVDLTNQGGFYPRVINGALDRLTILIQQLSERLSRTLVVPISDGESGGTLPSANERKGTVLAFNEVTGAPQVGPTIAAVGTVVANAAAINTVAANVADVNTVAANVADVTNFADVYYGPSTNDPTTRRDGSPLQQGDMYFNTTIDALRSFNGNAWRGVPNGAITVQNLSGDGIETEFLLKYAPEDETVTSVFVEGVYQQKNTYELGGVGGAWLIFNEAPPVGTDNIEVVVSTLQPSDDKLRQDLANSLDTAEGDALLAVKQPGSSLGRTQHAKNLERYTLADFPGVDLTGVTDSTVGVQAAIDYCAANGIDLHTGRGTVLVTQLVGRSNLILRGPGIGGFTFKRAADAATGYVFTFDSVSRFTLADFSIDGNKAAAVNAGMNILVSGTCSDYTIAGIESKNAKAVGGFGAGISLIGPTTGTQAGISYVRNCVVLGNEGPGISVTRVSGLTITDNYVYFNAGAGISIANLVFPPVADVANDLEVSRNRCVSNQIGILGIGYYRGGTLGAAIYGIEIPPSRHVNIIGNHCLSNTEYGIAWQAANAIISGNHISRNGNSMANGGALLNGYRTQFIDNNLEDNYYYGVDAGGAINSIVSGNIFVRTGATAGQGSTDINLGAAQSVICASNVIDQTGVAGVCTAIGAPRWDGDGVRFFSTVTQNLDIVDNSIRGNGNALSLGIYLRQGPTNIKVHGNRVFGMVAGRDYLLEGVSMVHGLNFSGNSPAATGSPAAGTTAAATTVIPDTGDAIFVFGSTTISRIETTSSAIYFQRVFKVDVTTRGSGYTSAPSVSFSGGGGTGAAGVALLGSDGTIIGVDITNHGSGYTSAPSVSFTGGGGSGAAGTATVGCDNFMTRRVTLLLQSAVTLTDGGNLALAGNMVATPGSTLTLIGYLGSWQEISRAIV